MIIFLIIGFSLALANKKKTKTKKNPISIIIPFHNEVKNLPKLIESINKLDYPSGKFEVILVNDCSNDNSLEWLETNDDTFKFKHFIINLTKKVGKKTAIEKAMIMVNFDKVVTTDADCILPINWLKSLDNFIQDKKPNMIVAPVNYKVENNFLAQFQLLDFMSMQGCTIGGFGVDFPFLCNGANFAYSKEEFLNLLRLFVFVLLPELGLLLPSQAIPNPFLLPEIFPLNVLPYTPIHPLSFLGLFFLQHCIFVNVF